MKGSTLVLLIMGAAFIAGVYLLKWYHNKRSHTFTGGFKSQSRWAAVTIAASLVVSLGAGVVLVNTVFGRQPKPKKRQDPEVGFQLLAPLDAGVEKVIEPKLKMVISDDPATAPLYLGSCNDNEVTYVKNGKVKCLKQDNPLVKTWAAQQKQLEKKILEDLIEKRAQWMHYRMHKDKKLREKFLRKMLAREKKAQSLLKKQIKNPPPKKQGLVLFGAAVSGTSGEKKPFKDRHAEIFYFLSLVLGVLAKYFWDHYEEKKRTGNASFEPHVIVMSFIIAAMVYYSIQEGLEKEVGKLTLRGVLFAFNNGFMWQTILQSFAKRNYNERSKQNSGKIESTG